MPNVIVVVTVLVVTVVAAVVGFAEIMIWQFVVVVITIIRYYCSV